MTTAEEPGTSRFSLVKLILIVPWVALVIDAWRPIGDSSFLWHVRAGSLQAEAGEVLTTDPFSFTVPGAAWLTQSWLVELLYAMGERVSGLGFVPWMLLIVGALTFAGIGLIAYRESRSVTATAFCLILSTLLLISFLVPRPVLFSFLLFVLVVLAWDRKQTRWTVPFLFWIWAAAHGSFVVGLAYVGLRLLSRREWRLLPTAVVSGLVTLATAHGLGVVEILRTFEAAREALGFISEWRRPAFSDVSFLAFVGGLAFIAIGVLRDQVRRGHFLLILPFVVLGITSIRAVPPAWIGLLPVVAVALGGISIGSKARFGAVSAGLFAVTVLIFPFLIKDDGGIATEGFPIAAKEELEQGAVFHDDHVGGYLIYSEGPNRQVFIDDRAELYLDRIEEFVQIRDGDKDWRIVFAREGIEQALLESDWKLIDWLLDAGWTTRYEDDNYVLLTPGSN